MWRTPSPPYIWRMFMIMRSLYHSSCFLIYCWSPKSRGFRLFALLARVIHALKLHDLRFQKRIRFNNASTHHDMLICFLANCKKLARGRNESPALFPNPAISLPALDKRLVQLLFLYFSNWLHCFLYFYHLTFFSYFVVFCSWQRLRGMLLLLNPKGTAMMPSPQNRKIKKIWKITIY